MISTLFWILMGSYALGAGYTFAEQRSLGMVTFRLALVRVAIWPVYWLTGRPRGTRLPMD